MNTTLALTDEQLRLLGKQLLSSWTGEYALRCNTPINPRPVSELPTDIDWPISTTYYAPLHGARAVLTSYQSESTNENDVREEIADLAAMGLYAPATENLFETVQAYGIASRAPKLLDHQQAIQRVNAIAHCHESFIVTQIGRVAYAQIVNSAPAHIRETFLDSRLALIADMDQLVNG